MRSLITLACLSFSLLLAGCTTPAERLLEPPALVIETLSPSAAGYELRVRLLNGNTAPLVVSSASHTLSLGGDRIGRIDDRTPLGVPPLAAIEHVIPVTGKSAAAVREHLAAKTGGGLVITVESTLNITLPSDDIITLKTSGRKELTP